MYFSQDCVGLCGIEMYFGHDTAAPAASSTRTPMSSGCAAIKPVTADKVGESRKTSLHPNKITNEWAEHLRNCRETVQFWHRITRSSENPNCRISELQRTRTHTRTRTQTYTLTAMWIMSFGASFYTLSTSCACVSARRIYRLVYVNQSNFHPLAAPKKRIVLVFIFARFVFLLIPILSVKNHFNFQFEFLADVICKKRETNEKNKKKKLLIKCWFRFFPLLAVYT